MTDPIDNPVDYNDFSSPRVVEIPTDLGGQRIDQALAALLTDYSRSRLQQWIKDGFVLMNGTPVNSKTKIYGGEKLEVFEQLTPEEAAFAPEAMPLNIVYEDDAILVIDKPVGLVVHPAAGNWSGTLLNGLLHYLPSLRHIPRAGIVHRLDKETSGLMVVAKTLAAQTDLVRQLQARTVKRVYRAIADGKVAYDGVIDEPIGRDPHQRQKMAVVRFGGKPAVTHVKVLERFDYHTYIECRLETGRTHQIRVHMKQAGHPLAGDALYGNPRYKIPEDLTLAVKKLGRQALHAAVLGLIHPTTGQAMSWKSRLPEDVRELLAVLREHQFTLNPDYQADEDDIDDGDDGDWEVIYTRE